MNGNYFPNKTQFVDCQWRVKNVVKENKTNVQFPNDGLLGMIPLKIGLRPMNIATLWLRVSYVCLVPPPPPQWATK